VLRTKGGGCGRGGGGVANGGGIVANRGRVMSYEVGEEGDE
jgi:hypothetical protein